MNPKSTDRPWKGSVAVQVGWACCLGEEQGEDEGGWETQTQKSGDQVVQENQTQEVRGQVVP